MSVDEATVELSYNARRIVRQNAGHHAAVVYDVLVYHDIGGGGGVAITAQHLATEASLSEKTVRRAIARLQAEGLIKSDSQFRNNRQVANCYHPQYDRLSDDGPDRLGGHGDQANTITSNQVEPVTDSHVVTNSPESVVLPGEQTQEKSREGLRPSTAENSSQENPHTEVQKPPAILWVPRNSPMPLPVGGESGGKRYIDIERNALWLVTYFEGYVLAKANQENAAKGRKLLDEISDKRKTAWHRNALNLVRRHPVREVAEVVDWVFHACSGYLPVWVAECTETPHDLKVTRIRQIEETYDLLVEEMNSGVEPGFFDESLAARSKAVNYGEPLSDPVAEAQVTDLVELFTEFQLACGPHKEIHHTRTWRWAKSFRIMLAQRGYTFDDLKMVVSALRDYPDMDRTRYNDAYDLHRGGEWEHVLAAAKLARLRADQKPFRSPDLDWQDFDETGGKGGCHDINELLDRWAGAESSSDDEPRSLNTAARPRKHPGYYQRNGSSGEL